MVERGLGRGFVARVVTVLVCAAFVLGAAPAQVGAQSRYEQLQQQIHDTRSKIHDAQRRENNLMGLITASDTRRSRLEATIASLGDRLALATARLDLLDARLAQVSVQLDQATSQLQDALARLDDQRAQVNSHAASLYIDSTQTYSTVLLGTHDYHDFVAGVEYQNRVLGSDVDFLTTLADTKRQVTDRRDAVQRQRDLLRRQQDAIAKQAARIGAIRQAQASAANAIARETSYRRRLLASVRDQKQTYLRALASNVSGIPFRSLLAASNQTPPLSLLTF